MPRNVRPAWLAVSVDGGAERATGPRSRTGALRAVLTLRTADGAVSDPTIMRAGGRYADGTGRAELTIGGDCAVTLTAADGTETVYSAGDIVALTIRPVA